MQPVDMRKQFQGLQGIINAEFGRYITQDEAFIFVGKTGTTFKILHREHGGLTPPDFSYICHVKLNKKNMSEAASSVKTRKELEKENHLLQERLSEMQKQLDERTKQNAVQGELLAQLECRDAAGHLHRGGHGQEARVGWR